MQLSDFDFVLPDELIAQAPAAGGRGQSRLMVLDRAADTIAHRTFSDIVDLLGPDDVLVMNNSRVFPARLLGEKAETGGAIEVLLLHQTASGWEALVRGTRVKAGTPLAFPSAADPQLKGRIMEKRPDGTWVVDFQLAGPEFWQALETIGKTPIPPYIKESPLGEEDLRQDYQTVYADETGSAAAPTAGLHFTDEILAALRAKGVETHFVTLHVGLGTFAPVRVDDIAQHAMHSEFAQVSAETAAALNQAKRLGKRIIAVGTTTTRTLESFAEQGELTAGGKWTNIFITPGYDFQIIDGLITNFHLPKSTLLLLVSALTGRDVLLDAYAEAIAKQYRFYSFGDAMFIA